MLLPARPRLSLLVLAALVLAAGLGLGGCRGRSVREIGCAIDPCPPDPCGVCWVEPLYDPACGTSAPLGLEQTGAFTRR